MTAPQLAAHPATPTAAPAPIRVPLSTRIGILVRLLAIQGSWNYETLLGNGIAFCMEPALKRLPGGRGGEAYRAAMARQHRYFNAHPYLAAVAVGALVRAELDFEPPARIERFRGALCGPLGSCGDRLVWAAWLPLCSLLALLAWTLGAGPVGVVLLFLLTYNAGHLALRAWGLHVGLARGLKVAGALGAPWLRQGPDWLGRVGAVVAGLVLPLAFGRMLGADVTPLLALAAAGAAVCGGVLVRVQGRVEGWRLALPFLLLFVLISVIV
jgi:PTS system mannose-specific IID component